MTKNPLDRAVEEAVLGGIFGAGHAVIASLFCMAILAGGLELQRIKTMPDGGWRRPPVRDPVTKPPRAMPARPSPSIAPSPSAAAPVVTKVTPTPPSPSPEVPSQDVTRTADTRPPSPSPVPEITPHAVASASPSPGPVRIPLPPLPSPVPDELALDGLDDLSLPPPDPTPGPAPAPPELTAAIEHLRVTEITGITTDLVEIADAVAGWQAVLVARKAPSEAPRYYPASGLLKGAGAARLEAMMGILEGSPGFAARLDELPSLAILSEALPPARKKTLVEAVLRHGSASARRALLAELGAGPLPIEPGLGPALATLLVSGDRKLRETTAGLLSRASERSLTTVLAAVLPKLTGPDRFAVLRALTTQGSTEHVAELRKGLASQDNDVRAHCLHALATQPGDPDTVLAVESAIEDTDFMLRQAAVHVLLEEGDTRAHEAMLQDLASPLPRTRLEALRTLADLGERSRSRELMALLKSKDVPAETRKQMLGILAACPDRGATRPLLGLIAHTSENVRQTVIEGLHPVQVEELSQALLERLTSEKSAPTRLAIARKLLGGPHREAAAKALLALAKEDPASAASVARALGHHDPRLLPPLLVPPPPAPLPVWYLVARISMP